MSGKLTLCGYKLLPRARGLRAVCNVEVAEHSVSDHQAVEDFSAKPTCSDWLVNPVALGFVVWEKPASLVYACREGDTQFVASRWDRIAGNCVGS